MAHEIILHHYWTSPFSEKIRLVFGLKRLAWRSVEVPNMMPKPDLLPLTGGYRKTPVMQIGADIFCDTQIIIRELERRYSSPSVFLHGKGLPYALAFWADRIFFMPTVGVVFGEIGDSVPEDFKKDRAAMSGGSFSTEALKAIAPFAKDQFRAHASFIAEQLADGRAFVQGAEPTIADIHCYLNIWFARGFVPQVANAVLDEFPNVIAWASRVAEIGHGTVTPMDSKEALRIAKEARPEADAAPDRFEPRGLKPGDRVTVSADDYGRDPIAGEIVFTDAHEIAIRREDSQVGEVVVHFPRAGFVVTRV
ncbi:MAG TPA: glutathione S-transferase family protein [Rhizomicrobium sp.]|nr:glutathione S-transferase family protein [Rhizomicrobium sp.]